MIHIQWGGFIIGETAKKLDALLAEKVFQRHTLIHQ